MAVYSSLITGLLLVLAAVLVLIRNFLLEPVWTHYPKAPILVRNSMLCFAAVLMYVGLHFLWVFASDQPATSPPQPSPYMMLMATALCLHKATLLINILRQRLPENVWVRLHRVNEIIHCKDGHPVWAWFSR